jgi:3-oxoacyl-[acyl-carrier-protein] synthase-1
MDGLARLGFVATELLLQKERETEGERNRQDRAVIFFNQSSSEHADKVFLASISDPENFFPSPSAFVYTLPNIVNGEIAIRNNYRGETAFFILPQKDDDIIQMITQATMSDEYHKSIISGWLEYRSENEYFAELRIIDYGNNKQEIEN